MKHFLSSIAGISLVLSLTGTGVVHGQTKTPTLAAPTIFRMSGTLHTATGEPRAGVVVMVASLYNAQADVTPLWSEAQTVTLDQAGRYSILVGASLADGVPSEYFLNGTGRWLGVGVQDEAEQPRVMLVSVPYALKAVDADTLAGKTAADFVLAENLTSSVSSALTSASLTGRSGLSPLISSTTGAIAKFTDTSGTVGNSTITESAGNVGIGTTTPTDRLQIDFSGGAPQGIAFSTFGNSAGVGAAIRANPTGYGADNSAALAFFTTDANAAPTEKMRITNTGNVGIGTAGPGAQLNVFGSGQTTAALADAGATGGTLMITDSSNRGGAGGAITFSAKNDNGTYVPQSAIKSLLVNGRANGVSDLIFSTRNSLSDTALTERLTILQGGNVGIGTTSPTAKLDVAGNINVSGNINAKYQDVAEWVETSVPLAPGTVVIVDPTGPNRVLAATKSYDTRVAGAVSKQPGLVLGEAGDTKAMVAQSGRVRIKVDASYGAIRVGDLLVTSPTPGYAMRSRPVMVGGVAVHRAGTLLGKALEALPRGKGELLVLLTLQ